MLEKDSENSFPSLDMTSNRQVLVKINEKEKKGRGPNTYKEKESSHPFGGEAWEPAYFYEIYFYKIKLSRLCPMRLKYLWS